MRSSSESMSRSMSLSRTVSSDRSMSIDDDDKRGDCKEGRGRGRVAGSPRGSDYKSNHKGKDSGRRHRRSESRSVSRSSSFSSDSYGKYKNYKNFKKSRYSRSLSSSRSYGRGRRHRKSYSSSSSSAYRRTRSRSPMSRSSRSRSRSRSPRQLRRRDNNYRAPARRGRERVRPRERSRERLTRRTDRAALSRRVRDRPRESDRGTAEDQPRLNGRGVFSRLNGLRRTRLRSSRREVKVDRKYNTPFLLKVMAPASPEDEGESVEPEELHVYVWMDSTLRDLVNLIKDISPQTRKQTNSWVFSANIGEGSVELGNVHSFKPNSREDNRTLESLKFEIGKTINLTFKD